jgi:hypothetical protein
MHHHLVVVERIEIRRAHVAMSDSIIDLTFH